MTWPPSAAAVVTIELVAPQIVHAQASAQGNAEQTGVSGLWLLANFAYAGMRAQANPSGGWRIAAFILGFPGTFVSYLAVQEGGERVYGVDMPSKRDGNDGSS